jgi:translation elongation factor EF-Ts
MLYEAVSSELPESEPGAEQPELDRLVTELLGQKQLERALEPVLEETEIDPWQIAELARRAEHVKLDAFVADGFVQRTDALIKELKYQKDQLAQAWRRTAEFRRLLDQANVEAGPLRQERNRALEEGKPEHILEKIVAGRVNKYKDEVVLMKQAYIRNEDISIEKYLHETVASIGENIVIRRFVRWEVGERSAS